MNASASSATRIAAAGIALILATTGAQASDAALVAERGGFLLGEALRCGLPAERLEPSAKLVHDLVAALSQSEDEQKEADRAFAARLVASAAPASGAPIASCARIRRQLALLERHNTARAAPGIQMSGRRAKAGLEATSSAAPGRSRAQ